MEWISEGKAFKGLLDTGVGFSAQHRWPLAWPLDTTTTDLQGVSSLSHPSISVKLLTWRAEGHFGRFSPEVFLNTPINLWRCDGLQDMKALPFSKLCLMLLVPLYPKLT